MIIVLAVGALTVIGILVTSAIGVASASRDRRARGSSVLHGAGPSVAIVGGVPLVVLLGVGVLALVGVGGGGDDAPPDASSPRATSPISTPSTTAAGANGPRDPTEGPDIRMQAVMPEAYGSPPPIVDRLSSRSVLRIDAAGFEPNATGFVEQCTVAGCSNPFPVTFDVNGRSRLQYLVNDAFAKHLAPRLRCRARDLPCFVRLRGGDDAAFLATVFHDVAPAPRRVTVDRSRGSLMDGARVSVRVSGFTPGERVQAMLCSAPSTYGLEHCGAPSPTSPFAIDADGTGRTVLQIRRGRVGSAGGSCGRAVACGIVVASARSAVPGPVLPVVFAAGPGARYDRTRLTVGLTVAALLLALAFLLARATDWRKPTEADTPDLDRAALLD